jgi:hypothetical protein
MASTRQAAIHLFPASAKTNPMDLTPRKHAPMTLLLVMCGYSAVQSDRDCKCLKWGMRYVI